MIKLGVDYRKDEEIAEYARGFLQEYHPQQSIPIPIEEIIDLKLGIDIIPLPGIQDLCDVDGFISTDFTAIYVDEFIYKNRPYRFRFTLAHEIGHFILHEKELQQIKLDPTDIVNSWAKVLYELDKKDHSIMEYQGYTFGGLILVPQDNLFEQFNINLPRVQPLIEQAQNKRVERKNYINWAVNKMGSILSPIFDVSIDVLTRRITNDKLDDQFP